MSQHRKITITHVERRRVVLEQKVLRVPCPACGVEVESVSEAEAAGFLSVGKTGLEELILAGKVHGLTTASGTLRICKPSLLDRGGLQGFIS
jgi:hypothetical protein